MGSDGGDLLPRTRSSSGGSDFDQMRRLALFPDPRQPEMYDLFRKQIGHPPKPVEPPKQVLRDRDGRPVNRTGRRSQCSACLGVTENNEY